MNSAGSNVEVTQAQLDSLMRRKVNNKLFPITIISVVKKYLLPCSKSTAGSV